MRVLIASAVCGVFLLAAASAATGAETMILTLSTAESQIDPGVNNQGFWAFGEPTGMLDSNDNISITGTRRNFFTFDLSGVSEPILDASLRINGFFSQTFIESLPVTYTLFEVSTDTFVLNNDNGTNADVVFADLGSGTSYGSVTFESAESTIQYVNIALNAAAIAELNAARGGFFSLGGAITAGSVPYPNFYIWGGTRGDQHWLRLTVPRDEIEVPIDIRPGAELNFFDFDREGILPVAILGSEDLDVADVDVGTLEFGPDEAEPAFDEDNPLVVFFSTLDVNGDGEDDMVTFFRSEETGIAEDDTEACLTGETLEGTDLSGCDAVIVCGVGFEIALVLPPLMWLRGRRVRHARQVQARP